MKRWILDHLPTIWVVAIFTFGIMLVYDHAKADDWIMKKPITYKEESKVNSAPVADVYINEISKKVEDKLKLIEENEKKGILKSTTLERFERDGQWCFIKIVIRQKGDEIIKEEIMECADTEHGRTDKEKIAELEKQIELEKAKKPGYWELFAAFYYKDLNAPEYCRLYSQPSHAYKAIGKACLTNDGQWERK